MNKKEKIAAYVEAYKESSKNLDLLAEYLNKNTIVRIVEMYDNLFKFILDIEEPHSKREKVEKYIDTVIAADAKLNEVSPYMTDRALEDIFKPYWDLEKNILDIPEEKKELLFYYMANEIDMTKEEIIEIIAG